MSVENIVAAIAVTAELTGTTLSGAAMKALAADLIGEYSEGAILQALSRCRRELPGRLTQAAIVERIDQEDGRPGSSEAWGVALQAFDESATVVTNDEILEAMAAARPVLAVGDEVGARAAFREAYDRVTRRNRASGVGVKWFPSLGHNVEARAEVIEQAVQRGLLDQKRVSHLLPAPVTKEGAALAGLLTGNVIEMPKDPQFRARIAQLRNVLRGKGRAA